MERHPQLQIEATSYARATRVAVNSHVSFFDAVTRIASKGKLLRNKNESAMNAVTLNEAKENLQQLIEDTLSNAEPTLICTDNGQRVVFLSLDEFNRWKETLYLLANPANAAHLRRSIAEAEAGQSAQHDLFDP